MRLLTRHNNRILTDDNTSTCALPTAESLSPPTCSHSSLPLPYLALSSHTQGPTCAAVLEGSLKKGAAASTASPVMHTSSLWVGLARGCSSSE